MRMIRNVSLAVAALAIALLATGGEAMALTLKSAAFAPGAAIPAKYTCDGADLSPPLSWSGAPADAKSFALISDDPDAPAGTWVHWVLWNIPAAATSLAEGIEKAPQLSDGTRQGVSDFRRPGYGGPCPPSGTHRYFFRLFALDAMLELPANATRPQLEAAMRGHILAAAELMGTFSRSR